MSRGLFIAFLLTVLCVSGVRSEEVVKSVSVDPALKYARMIQSSPFINKDWKEQQSKSAGNGNLQFNSYILVDGIWELSLFFPKVGERLWVKIGDEVKGIKLIKFDSKTEILTYELDQVVAELKVSDSSRKSITAPKENTGQQGALKKTGSKFKGSGTNNKKSKSGNRRKSSSKKGKK